MTRASHQRIAKRAAKFDPPPLPGPIDRMLDELAARVARKFMRECYGEGDWLGGGA